MKNISFLEKSITVVKKRVMNKLNLLTIRVMPGFVTMMLLDVLLIFNDFGGLGIYDKD